MRSSDLWCVHQTFGAFTSRLSCVHDQTFVRSPDYSCVHDQTFVHSPDYSCVHDQTFVRSPDYSCVHVQTFVRFSLFPDHVNLNARHPRRAFIWVSTYRLSVWDLNLGKGNVSTSIELLIKNSLQFCSLEISQYAPMETVFIHALNAFFKKNSIQNFLHMNEKHDWSEFKNMRTAKEK